MQNCAKQLLPIPRQTSLLRAQIVTDRQILCSLTVSQGNQLCWLYTCQGKGSGHYNCSRELPTFLPAHASRSAAGLNTNCTPNMVVVSLTTEASFKLESKGKAFQQRQQPVSQSTSQASASASQSVPQSQAERAAASIDPDELDRKVHDVVQFLLVQDQKKIPIKKLDINKAVLKEHSKAHGVVFGIEVVELQDKHKGSYILKNKLEAAQHLTWSEVDDSKTGLLMVVLSIVFMSGNVIQDGVLWHSLRGLGIDPEMPHETFGDVKKLIQQEFTRQGYLEFTRLQNSEQPVSEVRWGPRAKIETSKRKLLKFVAFIFQREPDEFSTQWQDMLSEEEKNQAAAS
ncbi:hypothetical protein BaRGS_00025964 [Batillaria attramentaria]|uniref:MAGE domain-containing protein n=1 Tax=Batillaria attramentaria TaxID=370345 RepID=A0ABD0K7A4_9CAEN